MKITTPPALTAEAASAAIQLSNGLSQIRDLVQVFERVRTHDVLHVVGIHFADRVDDLAMLKADNFKLACLRKILTVVGPQHDAHALGLPHQKRAMA